MSSAVYISFPSMVEIDTWKEFCEDHGIEFSPNTVGQNTFYQNQVQISLKGQGTLPKLPTSTEQPDFDSAKPPERFDKVTVSSFYGSNLDAIASLAKAIITKWDGTFTADEELTPFMSDNSAPDDSATDSGQIKIAALRNIKALSFRQLSILIKEIQQQTASGIWPEKSVFRTHNAEVANELHMTYSEAIDLTKKFILEEGSARMVTLTETYQLP